IDFLGPTNEPDNWADPVQGPQVGPAQYVAMLDKLVARMRAWGLPDIPLIGPDTASVGRATGGYLPAMVGDAALMAHVEHLGIHTYSGDSGDTAAVVAGSGWPGRDWWATEYAAWDGGADHGTPIADEWAFSETSFRYLLALLGQGASGAQVWDGVDSYYQ